MKSKGRKRTDNAESSAIPPDNRMGWIRNLETLASDCEHYTVEFELGSECRITGLLEYDNGRIICAPMSTEESKDGLWLYNLILHFPLGSEHWSLKADDEGYFFKEGITGELVALMSLFFRCRLYLISSRLMPENPALGMTIKQEYQFVRFKCNSGIHPPLFQNPATDFAKGFKEFLDLVKKLTDKFHQKFILACHHYARGVREVGLDPEMVFIRLVSAIEALSKGTPLTHKDDVLEETEIVDLIARSGLSTEHKKELKTIFDVRKSRKRFVRFIENHCRGYFKGGNFKAKRLKVTRRNLGKVLDAIYQARSGYLHSGEPMFLSVPFRGGGSWDTDPLTGMIVDRRWLKESQKLPYAHFFEGLVRHCLINYLKAGCSEGVSRIMSKVVFAYGSNMCSGRLRDYGVAPERNGQRAQLLGYRLVFNKKSIDGSGKANVEPGEGSTVWGVLYTISEANLRRLDNGEIGYQRSKIDVQLQDGTTTAAWVYSAAASSGDTALRPYTWYKRFLVEGAREHSLPSNYIAELEQIEAVQDTDAARDRRKRALECSAT